MSRFSIFPSRRMMSCRQVGEVLQAYLDGELNDLSAQRVARHLEACRRCGMELSVYTEIKASLGRVGTPVDADALDRLRTFGRDLASGAHEHRPPEEGTPSA